MRRCVICLNLSWFINEVLFFDLIHYFHAIFLVQAFFTEYIILYNIEIYLQQRPFSLIRGGQVGRQDTFNHILCLRQLICTTSGEWQPGCRKHDLPTTHLPRIKLKVQDLYCIMKAECIKKYLSCKKKGGLCTKQCSTPKFSFQ